MRWYVSYSCSNFKLCLTLLPTIIVFCCLTICTNYHILIFVVRSFYYPNMLFLHILFFRNRIWIVAITRFIAHISDIILKIYLELHITDIHILKSMIFLISEIFEVKQNIFILQVLQNVFLFCQETIWFNETDIH